MNGKQRLLDALKEFRANHGRMPIRQDWKGGLIEPCYMTFYREFGTVKKMAKELDLYERGETVFENKPGQGYSEDGEGKDGEGKDGNSKNGNGEDDREKPFLAKHSKVRTPFRCWFCGGYVQSSFEWSTARSYIIYRLITLIKKHFDDSDYIAAIFDSLALIFGAANQEVEKSLRKEGYYESYVKRVTPEAVKAVKEISERGKGDN